MVLLNSYENSVPIAKQQLESARKALSRDVADAVATANWPFLRDRADVEALIAHIDEAARQTAFVTKLHAVADKARQLKRRRGRPQKEDQQHKLPSEQADKSSAD